MRSRLSSSGRDSRHRTKWTFCGGSVSAKLSTEILPMEASAKLRLPPLTAFFKRESSLWVADAVRRMPAPRREPSRPRASARRCDGQDDRAALREPCAWGFGVDCRTSAVVKGFGRRPFRDGRARWRAGVRKPPKEETAGRKGADWLAAIYGDLRIADGARASARRAVARSLVGGNAEGEPVRS